MKRSKLALQLLTERFEVQKDVLKQNRKFQSVINRLESGVSIHDTAMTLNIPIDYVREVFRLFLLTENQEPRIQSKDQPYFTEDEMFNGFRASYHTLSLSEKIIYENGEGHISDQI